MRKLISMLLAMVMVLGLSVTTMAASSEGVTVDGWNGWTVTSGSAVTTKESPATPEREDVVKISGSAILDTYTSFEGAAMLSLDVYGNSGTISMANGKGEVAGKIDLSKVAQASGFKANDWNTVKLLILAGSMEYEVYLGDNFVEAGSVADSLTTIIYPTQVKFETTGTIYVDNIKIEKLQKKAAYKDGELKTTYAQDFSNPYREGGEVDGTDGWSVNQLNANSTGIKYAFDTTTYPERGTIIKAERTKSGSVGENGLVHSFNLTGSFVFDIDLLAPKTYVDSNGATVNNEAYFSVAFGLNRSNNDELIELKYDKMYIHSNESGFKMPLDKWYNLKIEFSRETMSADVYVTVDGVMTKINKYPISVKLADYPKGFDTTWMRLRFNHGNHPAGIYYLDNIRVRELSDKEIVEVFREDFNDSTINFEHTGNLTETKYLSLTAPVTGGGESDVGVLHESRTNASGTVHVGDGHPIQASIDLTTYPGSRTVLGATTAGLEYYYSKNNLDLSDAETVNLKFKYYCAAIARKSSDGNTIRDFILMGFGNAASRDLLGGVGFQGAGMKNVTASLGNISLNNPVSAKEWGSAEITINPSATNNYSIKVTDAKGNTGSNSVRIDDSMTSLENLRSANKLNLFFEPTNGGKFFLDDIVVEKTVLMDERYIKNAYTTVIGKYENSVTRDELTDLQVSYIAFCDADGEEVGIPTNGGKIKSVTVEQNASYSNAKLFVAVYTGNVLSDIGTADVDGKDIYTFDNAVLVNDGDIVKAFIFDKNTLEPLCEEYIVNAADRTKIFLVGDSLVTDYPETRYPLTGWGTMLGMYLNTNKVEVRNYAIGGAAINDFCPEDGNGRYAERTRNMFNEMRPGDYLLIPSSTNDTQTNENRYSNPYQGKEVAGSYQNKIMTYLVDKADAIGAIPILVSNGVRQSKYNSGGGYYRDNVCEHIKSISGLAFEEQLPLVDLYSMATDNLNTLGSIEATTKYYMVFKEADYADDPKFENSQYNDGDDTEDAQNDTTHTRVLGAQTAAGFVAKGLSMIDSISEYVK